MISVVVVFLVLLTIIVHDQGVVFLVLFQHQLWPTAMVSIDDNGVLFITSHAIVGNEKNK